LFLSDKEDTVIQLFLKYKPLKYILVFLVLVLIRAVAYKMSLPATDPEITWLLVGERMANGFTLYREIWTDLDPFSAVVYYFINVIFGKSTFVYFILSLILVFCQAVLFTNGLNKNKVFKEPTMLPALLYVLFSSLFFDFYTLSPVLLGTTFIIIAFNMICSQSKVATSEERFFYIGLLIGIASLFYWPFTIFILFALCSLGFYSNTNLKQQMVLVLAFFFPNILFLIYYFWIDNLGNYYQYALYPAFNSVTNFMIDLPTIIKITVLPFLLLLASITAVIVRGKYIHYQYIIIKISAFWLLFGFLAIWLEKVFTPHLFILFVPPLAFFTAHFFVIFAKKKLFSEVFFLIMFGGILLISFYSLKKPDMYTKAHFIKAIPEEAIRLNIQGKRVIVLGNNTEFYINNYGSSPYTSWTLSAWQFSDLSKYATLSAIYEVIETNKPDYIIDKEKRMEGLSFRIPWLIKEYERIDSTDIFRRKI
jgi:hypothetical protein